MVCACRAADVGVRDLPPGGVIALQGETDRSMLRREGCEHCGLDAILTKPAFWAFRCAGDTGGGLAPFKRRACDTGVTDLASDQSVLAVCGGVDTDAPDPVHGLFGDSGLWISKLAE